MPLPPPGSILPLNVPVELSFNQAQQFTSDAVLFTYMPEETVFRIYPYRQYVTGNEVVKVFTDYFFDKSAAKARCKFAYQGVSYLTDIVAFDDEGVTCFIPPAYLISVDLADNGGDTMLTVSSNGEDFSEATSQVFTYKKVVKISDVQPPFVLMDQSFTMSLIGENFYNVDDTGLLEVRLTRVVSDQFPEPLSTIVKPPYTLLVDENLVTFVFPNGVFEDKDWVDVELTFDTITWFRTETVRILYYKQIVLTKIRPSYVYTD